MTYSEVRKRIWVSTRVETSRFLARPCQGCGVGLGLGVLCIMDLAKDLTFLVAFLLCLTNLLQACVPNIKGLIASYSN